MNSVTAHDTTLGAGVALADGLAKEGHALLLLEPGNATRYRLTAVDGTVPLSDRPVVYLGLVGSGCYEFSLTAGLTPDPSYVAEKLRCTLGDGDVLADMLHVAAVRWAELHPEVTA